MSASGGFQAPDYGDLPFPYATKDELIAEALRLRKQGEALVEALERSRLAVDDLLAMYARDQVGHDTFRRAQSRINDRGGMLAYIAETQRISTAALAAVETP